MKSLSSSRHCQENVNTQRKSRKQQSIINKDRIEHHNNLSLSHLSLSLRKYLCYPGIWGNARHISYRDGVTANASYVLVAVASLVGGVLP